MTPRSATMRTMRTTKLDSDTCPAIQLQPNRPTGEESTLNSDPGSLCVPIHTPRGTGAIITIAEDEMGQEENEGGQEPQPVEPEAPETIPEQGSVERPDEENPLMNSYDPPGRPFRGPGELADLLEGGEGDD